LVILLWHETPLRARTLADEMEALIASPAVTWGEAARFVLEAAGAAFPSGPEEAFRLAGERGWVPKKARPDSALRLDGLSLLVMRAFGFRGGIFYSLVQNPHYAYRELSWKGYLPEGTDPAGTVSGETLLFILGKALGAREEREAGQRTVAAARVRGAEAEKRAAMETAAREERRREEERLVTEINARLRAERAAAAARVDAADVEARAEAETAAKTAGAANAEVIRGGVSINLPNIHFGGNSPALGEDEQALLRDIGGILKTVPGKLLVAGHAADFGDEAELPNLSRDRAQAVADFLAGLGVREPGEIEVTGYGTSQPVADNSTAEGRALNRRIEIFIREENR
jgi:outer membrane protein OmpA-like peptidoglycan-associated protein